MPQWPSVAYCRPCQKSSKQLEAERDATGVHDRLANACGEGRRLSAPNLRRKNLVVTHRSAQGERKRVAPLDEEPVRIQTTVRFSCGLERKGSMLVPNQRRREKRETLQNTADQQSPGDLECSEIASAGPGQTPSRSKIVTYVKYQPPTRWVERTFLRNIGAASPPSGRGAITLPCRPLSLRGKCGRSTIPERGVRKRVSHKSNCIRIPYRRTSCQRPKNRVDRQAGHNLAHES